MNAVNEIHNLKQRLALTPEEHEFLKTYKTQSNKKVVPIASTLTAKKCKTCGLVKPVDEFYKCDRTKDGLYGECISCKSEKAKKRYAEKKAKEVKMPNLNITDADFIAMCREIAHLRSELMEQKKLNEFLRNELRNKSTTNDVVKNKS